MYLALNNLQRLICHKTQPTNQPTNQPCLIVKVLTNYCTVINCNFNFHTRNVFGCFDDIMVQFELSAFKSHMSVCQLPWYYLAQCVSPTAWTASVTWYTCFKLACIKILQNFWFTLMNMNWIISLWVRIVESKCLCSAHIINIHS